MATCYRCGGYLPEWQSSDRPQDDWRMTNVAPYAASGGSMHPMHVKCPEKIPQEDSASPLSDACSLRLSSEALRRADLPKSTQE